MAEPYYDDGQVVIYHGDALEVLPTLGHFDLAVPDTPYNVGKEYDGYPDDLPTERFVGWLDALMAWIDADTLCWFPGAVNVHLVWEVLGGWNVQRLLAWHKKEYAGDTFTAGPAMCWEPIAWATKPGVKPHHNKVFGAWGRDLLVINSTHGDPLREEHPCPKPPDVLRWLIGLFCPPGGSVLDPVMGTGTALLEAKKAGRTAVGIEQSERYCEIAAERLGGPMRPTAAGSLFAPSLSADLEGNQTP